MSIDGVERLDRVRMAHLVNEAASWGLSRARAEYAIQDIVRRTAEAAEVGGLDLLPEEFGAGFRARLAVMPL